MNIPKPRLKQIIKEELSSVIAENKIRQIVDDRALDATDEEGISFFRSLVRATGKYLAPREQEIVDQLEDAVVNILTKAAENTYTGKFPGVK